MLSVIFENLTSAGSTFITFLTTLLNNVVGIFYDSTNTALTDIGVLVIVGVAASFVFFAIRWITRLIKLRG